MNNETIGNITRFILLILLQVLIFNHLRIGFIGNIAAYPCIVFVLLFPLKATRLITLSICFLFGLILDTFGNSGGAHAAACLVLAFARPLILISSFGISYEHQNMKFNNLDLKGMLIYVGLGCLIHHTVFFWLEVFSINHFIFILKQIVLSTVFTSICVLFFFGLIQKRKL